MSCLDTAIFNHYGPWSFRCVALETWISLEASHALVAPQLHFDKIIKRSWEVGHSALGHLFSTPIFLPLLRLKKTNVRGTCHSDSEVSEEWQPNNRVKNEFIFLPTSRNYSTQLTASHYFRLWHHFRWSVSTQWGALRTSLLEDVSESCSVILTHFIRKTWPTQETHGQLLKQQANIHSVWSHLSL